MTESYNPIVRTFGQLRAVLVRTLGLERRYVCPEMPLELLIPVQRRREIWEQLRRTGLRVPGLELSTHDRTVGTLLTLKTAVSVTLAMQQGAALPIAGAAAGLTYYWLSRPRAVCFPLGLKTLGELVLCATLVKEHGNSGYRWTHNEISLKVRLVLAETYGGTLEDIQEHTTFAELGGC
jgi:hypothetical protein